MQSSRACKVVHSSFVLISCFVARRIPVVIAQKLDLTPSLVQALDERVAKFDQSLLKRHHVNDVTGSSIFATAITDLAVRCAEEGATSYRLNCQTHSSIKVYRRTAVGA